jgi:hypothetical protein
MLTYLTMILLWRCGGPSVGMVGLCRLELQTSTVSRKSSGTYMSFSVYDFQ